VIVSMWLPVDAQQSIIAEWRAWLAREGKTYVYIYDDSSDAYF